MVYTIKIELESICPLYMIVQKSIVTKSNHLHPSLMDWDRMLGNLVSSIDVANSDLGPSGPIISNAVCRQLTSKLVIGLVMDSWSHSIKAKHSYG